MNRSVRKRKEQLKLDQMLRVLFKLSKKMTVYLINGLFDERFAEEEILAIHYGNSDFIRDDYDRIVGDLFLILDTKVGRFHYHVEFQTLNDQSMAIRMFRYGFEKAVELAITNLGTDVVRALEAAEFAEAEVAATAEKQPVIDFPQQLVIFLEENEAVKDELGLLLKLPNGVTVPYTVPVMKYWTYSAEDLRARRMYALLPLQVFGSRKRMRAIHESNRTQADKGRLMAEEFAGLKSMIQRTVAILGELHDRKEIGISDLERILRVMDRITEYLYSHYGEYQTAGKEMRQMIKTFIDPRVKREGKLEGKLEGRREGKLEGKREGKLEVAKSLFFMGIEMDKITQATGLTAEEVTEAAKKQEN